MKDIRTIASIQFIRLRQVHQPVPFVLRSSPFHIHTARSTAITQIDIHTFCPLKQDVGIMKHSPEHECKRGCELAEDWQREDNRPTNNRANQTAYRCNSHRAPTTQVTSQRQIATTQPQGYSINDTQNVDTPVHNLKGERHLPHPKVHERPDDNKNPPPTQLTKYVDDHDSTIIHFGVIGTHEGKTLIPKHLVHRNALDDLAHPYDQDVDVYVLDVNLDGDQIDCLLQYSEIYDAEYQKDAYQNSTTS